MLDDVELNHNGEQYILVQNERNSIHFTSSEQYREDEDRKRHTNNIEMYSRRDKIVTGSLGVAS